MNAGAIAGEKAGKKDPAPVYELSDKGILFILSSGI
jgi:hypothetical protein